MGEYGRKGDCILHDGTVSKRKNLRFFADLGKNLWPQI